MRTIFFITVLFISLTKTEAGLAEDFYVGSGQKYPDAVCSKADPGDFTSCERKLNSTDDRLILKCDSGTSCVFHCADHDDGGCDGSQDSIHISTQDGTSKNPIEIMAYPGHDVTFTAADSVNGKAFRKSGRNIWRSPVLKHSPNSGAHVKIKNSSTLLTREYSCQRLDRADEYCVNKYSKYIEVYSTSQPSGIYLVPYNTTKLFVVTSDYTAFRNINIEGMNNRGIQCGTTSGNGDTVGCKFVGSNPKKLARLKYCNDGCFYGNAVHRGGSSWTYQMDARNAEIAYNTGHNGHCYKCGSFDSGSLNRCEAHNVVVHHCADHGMWASAGTAVMVVKGLKGHSMNWGGRSGGYVVGANSPDLKNVVWKNIKCTRGDTGQTGCALIQGNASGYPQRVLVDRLIAKDTNYDGIAVFDSPESPYPHWPKNYLFRNIITYKNDRSGIRIEDSINVKIQNWSTYNDGDSPHEGALMLISGNADGVRTANVAYHSAANAYNIYTAGHPTIGPYHTNNRYYENGRVRGVINHNGSVRSLASWKAVTGKDRNSTEGHPRFRNPEMGYFKPLPGSALINNGRRLTSRNALDINGRRRGNQWNIGAVE